MGQDGTAKRRSGTGDRPARTPPETPQLPDGDRLPPYTPGGVPPPADHPAPDGKPPSTLPPRREAKGSAYSAA